VAFGLSDGMTMLSALPLRLALASTLKLVEPDTVQLTVALSVPSTKTLPRFVPSMSPTFALWLLI
jgi:hypothetical protein